MKNSKKLMILLFCISTVGFSNHGRYEQYWSDYEDFANNRGKFKIGQKGVIVYKKEGLGAAATIEQPIPNFDGMVDGGAYALWGDPQILSTASHVGNWGSFTFIQRHLRKDVELSEGFKNTVNTKKEDIVKEYSERVKMPYMRNLGDDYSIGRLKTIAFDGYTPETIKNRSQIHNGSLVARTGGGINSYAQDGGERYPVGYGNIAGGLNKIYLVDGGSFWIKMQKNFQTPLDSASRPGDSGSPAYIWDATNQKWLLAGENSAGSGADNNWNKISIIKQKPELVNSYLESIEDEKITDANVTLEGKTLGFGNSTRVIDDNVATTKNQTFAKDGLTLTVNSDSDTGASRFRFSENANITGTGKFNTAGLIIDKNVNVNYNIISDNNTVIRKRGEGSLTLNGNSKNDVEVNIGEGSLILDNSNGYAASHIRVAQGAKVILNKDNQLNDNKIYFGHRGGTLELKGHNLSFNDIYHLDKDAVISNKESTDKATFKFTQGNDRVFLGKFSGNMDVEYNPNETKDNAKWNLRGNTDITGDLNVKKGTVSISGDVITSGYENNVLENQFEKTTFKATNINVDNGSTLQLDRATKVDSNINVSGKLNLNAKGEVLTKLDKTKPYLGYEDQSEVNKVNVNGNITFNGGASNNFNVNVENNNLVEINSKISGTVNGIKDGNGLVKINNENNDFLGNLAIKNGVLESENENILSNGKYKIEEKGLLRLNNNSNFGVLDKIDKTSTGVISLGKSLAELDKKYSSYANLYIGSKNNITIGANDKAIDKSISNINLGGDNGTVTLKGLELEDGTTVRNINAGNNKHRGNVVIDGLSSTANVNISIRDGINFVVNNNHSNSQFLDLGYGATAGNELHNNLKDSSIGVLELTNENSINVKNVAVGAKKDSNVTLNSYTTTNDKTRFSGEGNLTYTATLGNKELEVDAQNLSGGVVTLTGDNKDFNNKVTVMGNKNRENKGSITLKVGNKLLNNNNDVTVKDGGTLDINDNDVSIKLNNDSNQYGNITNSGNTLHNVTINNDSTNHARDKTIVKTNILGNINIIKEGKGTIEFNNKNDFKGTVTVNRGFIDYTKDVLSNDIIIKPTVIIRKTPRGDVTINEVSRMNLYTNKVSGSIKGLLGIINLQENNLTVNKLVALTNTGAPDIHSDLNVYGKGIDNSKINYKNIEFQNDTEVFMNKQDLTLDSIISQGDNTKLHLSEARLRLTGLKNTVLTSGLKALELTGSKILLRDYNVLENINKNSNNLTKIIITADTDRHSEISNGGDGGDNGGGAGANFINPIEVKNQKLNSGTIKNATLLFRSAGNFGAGTGLTINSKISGDGTIKVRRDNNAKFEIQDNFKDFTGKLMSDDQPDVNYDYNISSNNAEDRVIGYNLTGVGSYTNKSNKDLTFTNLLGFTGKLVAQNGDIVLKDENAINNTGKVETYNNTNITLLSNNNIDANNLKLENKNVNAENTNKVVKDGTGKLSLGDNTSIVNFKTFEVKSGELELKKNIEVSNIELKDSTKLDLNFITNGTITSEITGTGDLIKVGTTKIDIEGSKLNSTGSIDLQEGELSVTGDKVLSNKVKGSADLTFKNSNVEVKDIENFSGNLNLDNANLTLKEDKAFDSEAKIKAKGTSNVTLDITGDKTLTKLNVENQGSETNKLEKTGLGKLTLGENANIVNYKNLDVKVGTLEVSKNISVENISLETNTKLNVNNAEDVEMASNIKGTGNIVKLGEGKLSIASSKLNSEGNIDLQAGELSVTGDKVLSNKVKGSADLTFKNSNVEVKDIENFSGNLNLDNANLTLKEDKAFDSEAKIKAKGTSNVTLDITGDKTLTKLNVENQGSETNKLEKTGLGKLTLGENANIVNYKNLDVKVGTLELTKNVNVDNLNLSNDTKLNLNLSSNGTITSNLNGDGDIVKLGEGKLSIASSKLNSEGNIDLQAGELSVTGDKVLSNKVKGSADLTFKNSNVEVKDIENFSGNLNLDNANLTLKEDKAFDSEAKIKAKGTSNVTLDITGDKTLTKLNVENQGSETNKLEKTGLGKLTLGENANIVNYKNLDVKVGTLELTKNVNVDNLNLSNDTKLNLNLSSNGTITLNLNGDGDIVKLGENKVDISSSKLNSSGDILIDAGTLNIKMDRDKIIENKLKGTGNLKFENFGNSELNIKDTSNFNGNINLSNINLTLDDEKALNSNYNFDGNSRLKLLNDRMYQDMKLSVNTGKLNIDSLNKIDAKINVAPNSELTFTQENNFISKLTNNGLVSLLNQRLTINNYMNRSGIFNITLNKILNDTLNVENSDSDINVNLNLSEEVLNTLEKQKLRIGKTNKKFNILNLSKFYSINGKKILLSNENSSYYLSYEIEKLLKKYDIRLLSIMNNNTNLFDVISKISYKNFINAKYVNQNRKDINKSLDSDYLSKNNLHGVSVEVGQINKDKNLAYNVEFIYLDNKLSVDGNDRIESGEVKYKTFAVIPKIGYKKGIFDVSTSLGVVRNDINMDKKLQTTSFVNNVNIGLNPQFDINENIKLTYVNNIGYNYMPMKNEKIKNKDEKYEELKSKLSNIYYETGVKLENKIIGLDFVTQFRHYNNHSEVNGEENREIKEKYFETNTRLGLSINPINNLLIKTGMDMSWNKVKKNKYKFDFGFEYKW